ncbi:MAG: hypothetical protein JNN08_23160 [Bryobacterales bacterium]|nr:hypothetical protein [Bryobacterales bacterium]
MIRRVLLLIPALLSAGQLGAQTQPAIFQTVSCVKVERGKQREFREHVTGPMKKLAQMRMNAGTLLSWSLLRTVVPAGEEAPCDYSIIYTAQGSPYQIPGREQTEKDLKAAGVNMSVDQYYEAQYRLAKLASRIIWQNHHRVGTIEKGSHLYVNWMKVHDMPGYVKFEREVWLPMAEAMIKSGTMKAWVFGTKVMPAGAEEPYMAFSADVFADWKAAFGPRGIREAFEKAHPGKNIQEVMGGLNKLRTLARRHLVVVEDRIAKQ